MLIALLATAFLRAERDTAGSGRTYTLELRVYDDDGAVIDALYPEVYVPLGKGCGACSTGVGTSGGLAGLALLGGLVLLRRREG
ncbi:MAG TPA: MYXO-CTERM sorting domain-containing protein [Myxococcota bacterium]|jgi:MYXO-CTERM domain-containing protein|nr:MYXO-CTERM sorting domain-containing protein [Myxococcota bacterium]